MNKRRITIVLQVALLFCTWTVTAQIRLDQLPAAVYRHNPDLKLYFVVPPQTDAGAKLPAIVFFFGGGWTHGNPTAFLRQADYFSRRGMIAILADYRTKNRHGVSPDQCVADSKSVMRYLKTHADEWHIDTTRLAAAGGSAGGHLAAATALVKGFDAPEEDRSVSPRPSALLLLNPVLSNAPAPEGYGYDLVQQDFPAISPLHNIHVGAPPTLIMSGDKDRLIPVSTVKAFARKMRKAGAPCEVEIYEGAGHSFFNYSKNPDFFRRTLIRMDDFLVSLGFLKPRASSEEQEIE